jgi:plastocyanin
MNRSVRGPLAALALSLVVVGALHCGDDAATPAPTGTAGTAGTSGTAGSSANTAGSAGASGSGTAGTGGVGGTGGEVGGAAGTTSTGGAGGGSSGAAGTAAGDPIETTQGCVGKYVDLSAADATRTIEGIGVSWSPPCVEIAAGQTLTWDVNFSVHPLRPGTTSDKAAGSPNNPIPSSDGGPAAAVTFPTAGFYPFHCAYHATPDGKGMVGLVHVK